MFAKISKYKIAWGLLKYFIMQSLKKVSYWSGENSLNTVLKYQFGTNNYSIHPLWKGRRKACSL